VTAYCVMLSTVLLVVMPKNNRSGSHSI